MLKFSFLFLMFIGFSACQAEDQKSLSASDKKCRENSGQVCGQPPMPPCPEGQMCAQVMPKPQIYENECERKKAGASPLPQKACEEVKTK